MNECIQLVDHVFRARQAWLDADLPDGRWTYFLRGLPTPSGTVSRWRNWSTLRDRSGAFSRTRQITQWKNFY